MILGTRESVSAWEEKLLRLLAPLNNAAATGRMRKDRRRNVTVRELCQLSGIARHAISYDVQDKLDCVVPAVCRAGSRFVKGCICVQFYEDGDQVMRWAMDHGALLCITRSAIEGLPCIVVSDPCAVYTQMCKYYRDLSNIEVTAVVGSIGKTTTKRMISAVYAAQYKTFADPENENQLDCVGYICQGIPETCRKQVQEVSEDTPGYVGMISHMLSPKYAVVTAVDKSHIEAYGSEEAILREIASITQGMPEEGKVIVNIDDNNTRSLIKDRSVVTVSMNDPSADIYAQDICLEQDGLRFSILEKGQTAKHTVKLKYVYAKHNIYSALYAFAVGVHSGMEIKNIIKGLEIYRTSGIRQNVYMAGKTLLYVDCYNAVARSMQSAIVAANEIPVENQRIAVLADVEETGAFSESIHREIVDEVNRSDFDVLLAYGPKMIHAAETTAVRESLTVITCNNREVLNNHVRKYAKSGNLLLFKSSRKSELERTISAVWPIAYRFNMLSYYFPLIKWRIRMLLS